MDPKPVSIDYSAPDAESPVLDPQPLIIYPDSPLYGYLQGIDTRISALELIVGDGLFETATGEWQVNANVGAVPGGTQITSDDAVWADATWLRFSKVEKSNDKDMTTILNAATSIYGRMKRDSSNWARWTVIGATVDGGSYIQVPVTLDDNSGSIDAAAWQDAIVVFQVPA